MNDKTFWLDATNEQGKRWNIPMFALKQKSSDSLDASNDINFSIQSVRIGRFAEIF